MVFLFFEFKGDEHTKLAVAVINKSNATDINPDLNFIAKEILDLDKLHLVQQSILQSGVMSFRTIYSF